MHAVSDGDRQREDRLVSVSAAEGGDPANLVETLMRELGLEPTLDARETITPDALRAMTTRVDGQGRAAAIAREKGPPTRLPRIDVAATEDDAPEHVDYVVKEVLGEGGMGRVLTVHQRSLGREVAVKIVRDDGDVARASEMLLAEALVTGSLAHPNIVPVHALGSDAYGRPILVMKKVEGVPWSRLLEDPTHEAWARIEPDPSQRLVANINVLMRVCDGIHYAHSRGVIHRDIKPSNVMVGAFGEVYVVDWGVAIRKERIASAKGIELAGTASYMAPEMASGDLSRIDERTDVYLLGATLHAILTGEPRHKGKDLGEVLAAATISAPATYGPEVPSELAAICNRACAVDPKDRFESVLDFRRALSDYLRHRSSIELCKRLGPLVEELERRVADETRTDRDAENRLLALLSECRFGYEQALREWPSNPIAREGLLRVLVAAVRVEIAQGDAVGARAALAQLAETGGPQTPPPSDLVALVEEAEQRARKQKATLERIERDMDLRVGARQRALVLLLLLPLLAVSTAFLSRAGMEAITHANMVSMVALMNVAIWLAIAIGRAKLFATAVNRRLVLGVALMLALWLANRLVGWSARTPLNVIGATDLFILAAISAGAWAPHLRRFVIVSVVAVAAAVGVTLRTDWWAFVFAVAGVVALAAFVSLFLERAPREPR